MKKTNTKAALAKALVGFFLFHLTAPSLQAAFTFRGAHMGAGGTNSFSSQVIIADFVGSGIQTLTEEFSTDGTKRLFTIPPKYRPIYKIAGIEWNGTPFTGAYSSILDEGLVVFRDPPTPASGKIYISFVNSATPGIITAQPGNFTAYENVGGTALGAPVSLPMTMNAVSPKHNPVAAGFFNGDEIIDLIVARDDAATPEARMWVGDGSGGFWLSGTTIPDAGQIIRHADLDFDGDLDLAIANETTHVCNFYRNDGANIFTFAFTILLPDAPSGVADIRFSDVNSDGYLDLLSLTKSGKVHVHLGLAEPVWVANTANVQLVEGNNYSVVSSVFGVGAIPFNNPVGIAVGKNVTLVTDTGNNKVVMITNTALPLPTTAASNLPNPAPGAFVTPKGVVAVVPNNSVLGDFYISDAGEGAQRLLKYTGGGVYTTRYLHLGNAESMTHSPLNNSLYSSCSNVSGSPKVFRINLATGLQVASYILPAAAPVVSANVGNEEHFVGLTSLNLVNKYNSTAFLGGMLMAENTIGMTAPKSLSTSTLPEGQVYYALANNSITKFNGSGNILGTGGTFLTGNAVGTYAFSDIMFLPPTLVTTQLGALKLFVDDLNGDGDLDLGLTGLTMFGGVKIFDNTTAVKSNVVTFAEIWTMPATLTNCKMAPVTGDFSGTGSLSLAVGQYNIEYPGANDEPAIKAYEGNGAGAYSFIYDTSMEAVAAYRNEKRWSMGTTDFNGDGKNDIVMAGIDKVWVYLSETTGGIKTTKVDIWIDKPKGRKIKGTAVYPVKPDGKLGDLTSFEIK